MKNLFLVFLMLFGMNCLFAQSWKSYTFENSGLPDSMVNSIAIAGDGTVWFATNNGLAAYKDNDWKTFHTENGLSSDSANTVSFRPLNSQKLWVATNLGASIFDVNANNDITNPQYINKAGNNILSDIVTAIEVNGMSNYWVGTDKGLSILTSSGTYNFTKANGLESNKINALEVLSDDWVHVATAGGGVSRLKYNGINSITTASNIVTTWSSLPSDTVLTIYVTDDTLRWYGTTAGAATFRGDNSKDIDNWWVYNTFSSGIIDNYVRAIIRDKDGNMWFGTKKGLSKLSPVKSKWQSFTESDGLISNNIFDLAVDSKGNLWIATDKGVSYYSNLPNAINNDIPVDYKIDLRNYPNPFNPITIIDYNVPELNSVRLEVFNNLGQLVEVLVDKRQNAGNYQINFNGNKIPSGVYLYRLTIGKSSITKKMVLLK